MLEVAQEGWGVLFFALLIGHAFGDYAFQTQFISKAKCPSFWANSGKWNWLPVLLAHSLIHSGMVWVVTGVSTLALLELVLHALIDKLKCDRRYGFMTDQVLHVACKAGYVIGIVFLVD